MTRATSLRAGDVDEILALRDVPADLIIDPTGVRNGWVEEVGGDAEGREFERR